MIMKELNKEFLLKLYRKHESTEPMPFSDDICSFAFDLLELLFPAAISSKENEIKSQEEFEYKFAELERSLVDLLIPMESTSKLNESAEVIAKKFFAQLPQIYHILTLDVDALVSGDPAAKSEYEVIRAYPGFIAIALYRMANALHLLDIPVIPRVITESAHTMTGIDIHPGATIGAHFCIDHGTGIVIGETSIIGEHVKLYQGVTLGALSVKKSMASTKRHPTIEDHVVIYAGATILGGDTIIGHHSIIGGNVWLTKTLPAYSTAYHRPQIEVSKYDAPELP